MNCPRPSTPALSIALLIASTACRTTPSEQLPVPLPATLAWVRPPAASAPPFLGLKTRENDSGRLDALAFAPGVRVTHVVEQSPAAASGFQVGDVVLAVGATEVDDPEAFEAALFALGQDGPHAARVRRGDSVFDVPFELTPGGAEAPETLQEVELLYRVEPSRSGAGWLAGRGGVVLVSSAPDGPFPSAGVAVGSVVFALDGRSVMSERALLRELEIREPGERIEVEFASQDGARRTARVTLMEEHRRVTHAGVPILFSYEAEASGESVAFELLDLWLISLFRYERDGREKHWSLFRFLRFESGVGELEG